MNLASNLDDMPCRSPSRATLAGFPAVEVLFSTLVSLGDFARSFVAAFANEAKYNNIECSEQMV